MNAGTTYGKAILEGFRYLLKQHPDVFIMGQGLWSPWYVGDTMTDLEKDYGKDRVIDTPISEDACTGAAIGASLCGYRVIVIHPRIDFMILASNTIVNQAAKWCHMLGGKSGPAVTIRGIINRGGEQGAQHSQALHSWYAHIPGLRVVMPATPKDARDLLIASVLCDDPVIYMDDRWLYNEEAILPPPEELDLAQQKSMILRQGSDITLTGAGHSVLLCRQAATLLEGHGISCEVVDLRILNPIDMEVVTTSVARTGRLCVVDGGWSTCGLAGEILAGVAERLDPKLWLARPVRVTLPPCPAPTSKVLESIYYPTVEGVVNTVLAMMSLSGVAKG